ncbi:MAG: extracellular solute-binding protein [Defluviitaleaceae bacterium]|nr:extracellular solute-binding protein [Defluviitaleaceae bacterium]MCL2274503.1 extracellular solute-binding protein [Defluviitaleaceae bacterium]
MKKAAKFLLCAGVMLLWLVASACGSGNNEDGVNASGTNGAGTRGATPLAAGAGRYVEVDITPPINGRIMLVVAPDGGLVAFDEGLHNRYDSADNGITWVHATGVGAADERFADVQSVGLLPDGRLLVYLQEEGLTAVSADGTTAHFPMPYIDAGIADGDEFNVSFIHVLDNERVLLTYNVDWIARFMRDGGTFQMFGEEDDDEEEETDEDEDGQPRTQMRVGGTVAAGGGMAFGSMNAVTAIHCIQTGRELERLSHTEFMQPMGANAQGGVYTVASHNLVLYSANGDVEVLLNGTAFAFGSPAGFPVGVSSLPAGGFIANVMQPAAEEMVSRLLKYIWDENATINPGKDITIWTLEDNALVRAAITEVWRLYPEANFTLEIALSEEGGVTATDAIRTLNTRLLSGRGPDVIIMDGTPFENYANRGMLLDLTGRVDTAGMYQNLLAPFAAGGLYVLPTQFTVPMMVGEASHLRQALTPDNLVQAIVTGNPLPPMEAMLAGRVIGGAPDEDSAFMGFNDLDELFHLLWIANVSAFIHDNRLDSNALGEFFTALYAISEKFGLGAEADMMQGGVATGVFMVVSGGGGATNRVNMLGGSMTNFLLQTAHTAAFEAGNIHMLSSFMRRDNMELELALLPGLAQGAWVPSTLVGISADTAMQDFAVTFVNAMLSMEVQRLNHGTGFSMLPEATAWQLANMNEILAEVGMPLFEPNLDVLIAQLSTPALIETTLREMVWQTAERLADGRLTVEGAVAEVEQNIRNYLAERS